MGLERWELAVLEVLTKRVNKLEQQFAALQADLKAHKENKAERLEEIARQIRELQIDAVRALDGNGHPGLKQRLDRIEQREKWRIWLERAALGAGLLALATWLFDKLAGK